MRGTPSAPTTLPEVADLAYFAAEQFPAGVPPGLESPPASPPTAHLVQRRPHLHLRGRPAHRACHAAPLRRERGLRRAHQPERRRGPIAGGVVQGSAGRSSSTSSTTTTATPPPPPSSTTCCPPPPSPVRVRPHRDRLRPPRRLQGDGGGRRHRRRRPRCSTRSPTRSLPSGSCSPAADHAGGPRAGHLTAANA